MENRKFIYNLVFNLFDMRLTSFSISMLHSCIYYSPTAIAKLRVTWKAKRTRRRNDDDEYENNTLKIINNEREGARRVYNLEEEPLILLGICEHRSRILDRSNGSYIKYNPTANCQVACFHEDQNETLAVSQVTEVSCSEPFKTNTVCLSNAPCWHSQTVII